MTDHAHSGDVIGHFRWRPAHEEMAGHARDAVNGLSTDELRQDGNLRKYIADEIAQLRVAVDKWIIFSVTSKIFGLGAMVRPCFKYQ